MACQGPPERPTSSRPDSLRFPVPERVPGQVRGPMWETRRRRRRRRRRRGGDGDGDTTRRSEASRPPPNDRTKAKRSPKKRRRRRRARGRRTEARRDGRHPAIERTRRIRDQGSFRRTLRACSRKIRQPYCYSASWVQRGSVEQGNPMLERGCHARGSPRPPRSGASGVPRGKDAQRSDM